MEPKIRVWVVFGKQLKLGAGRAQLLRLIDERGSLRQAAAEFGMSYRNAWGYLQELEQAAGFRFVERTPGAGPRSGMRLTPAGRDFLPWYQKFVWAGAQSTPPPGACLPASCKLRGAPQKPPPRRHFAGAFKGKEFRTRTRLPERSARTRA